MCEFNAVTSGDSRAWRQHRHLQYILFCTLQCPLNEPRLYLKPRCASSGRTYPLAGAGSRKHAIVRSRWGLVSLQGYKKLWSPVAVIVKDVYRFTVDTLLSTSRQLIPTSVGLGEHRTLISFNLVLEKQYLVST